MSYSVICYTEGMSEWFKKFLKLFQSPDNSVIGVDVGSAYLKIVQLRRKGGKAVLETYGSLALGPYAGVEIGRATHLPADKLAEALRDLLREAHATSTRAAFAIPFSSSLVTVMDMRVLDQKELATMVALEARKYIPVPISEVSLDWWIIPEEPERISEARPNLQKDSDGQAEIRAGKPFGEEDGVASITAVGSTPAQLDGFGPRENSAVEGSGGFERAGLSGAGAEFEGAKNLKILIAAIHNEALGRYGEVVKGSGLESSFFEIELFSTIRSLFPQDLDPHAVLDLGAGETKLYIIDRGLVRLSHIMSHGGQDITLALSRGLGISVEEAEKMKREQGLQSGGNDEHSSPASVLNVIFSETNRTILNFERKFGRKVADVVLSGGGANLPSITALATEGFSIPVKRADPFLQVEAPAFLEGVLQGVGPEFTVAVGIAFRKLQESA